jgi:hypothetical protein
MSNGYLYFNGEYAEILEESSNTIPWEPTTSDAMVGVRKGVIDYAVGTVGVDSYLENSGFTKSNPEAYNWLMKDKPSIETVQSVDVNLRTKKQINKFKF